MKVSFEGFGENAMTFEAQETGSAKVTVGETVVMCGNGKVAACTAEGDIPAGLVVSLRGGYACVQVGGYMKLPCSASLTVGYQRISVDAEGRIQADVDGRGALVVDVDQVEGLCGVIL